MTTADDPRRVNVTVRVELDLLQAGRAAVTAGEASNLHTWVNEALRRQVEHQDEYEVEPQDQRAGTRSNPGTPSSTTVSGSGEADSTRIGQGPTGNLRLERVLIGAGLTYVQVAEKLAVDPITVKRWVTLGRRPYPRHRHKLAALVGVPATELWPPTEPHQSLEVDDRAMSHDGRSSRARSKPVPVRNLRLERILDDAGLTYVDVADEIEVHPKTVERWVTLGKRPYPRHRHKLAALVGVPANELWPPRDPNQPLAVEYVTQWFEQGEMACLLRYLSWFIGSAETSTCVADDVWVAGQQAAETLEAMLFAAEHLRRQHRAPRTAT